MFNTPVVSTIRIAIYGKDMPPIAKGVGLWPSGYDGALSAAGAVPVRLEENEDDTWTEILRDFQGIVLAGGGLGREEQLCVWCKDHAFPILAIDQGLLSLNLALGGTNYEDLPKELPEALQHRHPPEKGLRHAIMVEAGTRLADIYGEGEIVVNSEHRQAVRRPAAGLMVSACALDGVVEALEARNPSWFGMGVQWQPAASTASGLDIQVFRGLVDAAGQRTAKPVKGRKLAQVA